MSTAHWFSSYTSITENYILLYVFPCEPMSPQEVASLRHGVENQVSMMLFVLLCFQISWTK